MKRLWWGIALSGLAVLLVLLVLWPYWNKRRFTHSFTLRDHPSLHIELYAVGLLGNLTAMYLTDSTAFRLYAGTYDPEGEYIYVQAIGDQLTLTKMHDRAYAVAMGLGDQPVVEKRDVYSLQHLRQAHAFE